MNLWNIETDPALLREWRERNGYTQEDVARGIGVTLNTVSRWERGRGSPLPFMYSVIMDLIEGRKSLRTQE